MNTKALRQKVLDLAIHGKLVPQNPNDESATVLLEKIRAEKAEKIKNGELKADKKDSFIFVGSDKRHYEQFSDGTVKDIEDEIPFVLPKNWAWCRLKEIISINPRNKLDENLEVSFIPMTYIDADYKNTHKQEKRVWKEIKTGFTHFAENDVAIAKISPCFENRKSVILHNLINGYGAGTTELFILRTTSVITSEYLLWIVKTDDFINAGVGNFSGVVGQQRLAKDVVENYLIPLPPFEEQQRIVSSINDAFSQINLIENNSTDLQTAIKQAKSKILDLAIHGKLVPQDPNDEPAEELLKRIATSDNRPYEKLDEEPFEIPDSWCWVKLSSICTKLVDGDHNPPKGIEEKTDYIMASSRNINYDRLDDLENVRYLTKEVFEIENERTKVEKGDLFFTSVGTLGRSCIYDGNYNICFQRSVTVLRTTINNQFLKYYFDSGYYQNYVVEHSTGTAQMGFYLKEMANSPIVVPPKEEQDRIVSQINELFMQLDQIQNNLV